MITLSIILEERLVVGGEIREAQEPWVLDKSRSTT